MMNRKMVLAAVSLLGLALGAPLAIAHRTGHESRTVGDCEKLPTPERGQCISCVKRPQPHHYHPDYPAGSRCRPDNGKP